MTIKDSKYLTMNNKIPPDVDDEIRLRKLRPFIDYSLSYKEKIVMRCYENEKWHPLLNTWGSLPDIFLHKLVDRRSLTDFTNEYSIR